jgi:hypothetical protein
MYQLTVGDALGLCKSQLACDPGCANASLNGRVLTEITNGKCIASKLAPTGFAF